MRGAVGVSEGARHRLGVPAPGSSWFCARAVLILSVSLGRFQAEVGPWALAVLAQSEQ